MSIEVIQTVVEVISAILILIAFELLNRKHLQGYSFMAVGQLLAAVICVATSLWFLAFMHVVNCLLMVRGYLKWKTPST